MQYIHLLQHYCESGLLDGQFLLRCRTMLKTELDEALRFGVNKDLLGIKAITCLKLHMAQEAKQTAEQLLSLWPADEGSWLKALQVAVETRNQEMLQGLRQRIRHSEVDWSRRGRDQLALWMEKSA